MIMLKRFISYYRPHLLLFSADMAASLLISLIGMVYPVMTNRLLNDFIPNRAYRSIIIAGAAVLLLFRAVSGAYDRNLHAGADETRAFRSSPKAPLFVLRRQ